MIARKLPAPDSRTIAQPSPQPPASRTAGLCPPPFHYADHTLLTEKILKPYSFPEHIPGAGILTLLAGTGRFTINNETISLNPTRYLLINRDTRLSLRLPHPDTQPLFLYFRTDVVNEALTKQHADFSWLERTHPMNATLRERLVWLASIVGSCSSFSNLRADAMIRDILLEFVRQAQAAEASAAKLTVARQSTRIALYKRLSEAREWIHANYASPAPLEKMAEAAQLNSQHFLRMFRDCFGITPHQYIIDLRLAAARELLSQTEEPVTAICRLTGFESLSSFSGLFRQRFGVSPKAYRNGPGP